MSKFIYRFLYGSIWGKKKRQKLHIYVENIYLSFFFCSFLLLFIKHFFSSGAKIFHPHVTYGGHDGHLLHKSTIWELQAQLLCFKPLLMKGSCDSFQVYINLFEIRSTQFFLQYNQNLRSTTFSSIRFHFMETSI